MAALDFPSSPSVDDLYTANGSTWKWDGTSWNIVPANALLSTLEDVSLTSLTSGDSLHYNGTDWVNKLTDFQVTETATGLTASSWDYIVVTAATQTITLPASPADGDMVGVSVGDFTDTVIGRNGNTISGVAEDLTIDVANMGLTFVYTDTSSDWRLS